MARVDKNWLLDYVELALIVLLGVGLWAVALYYKRRVSAADRRAEVERRRADEAHRRLDEADQRLDQAAAERAALAARQAEQAAFVNAVITELRLSEGQQQHTPALRLVKKAVGPVATLGAWMWAAKRTLGLTAATGTALVVVAASGVKFPVYDVPDMGQHAPPAAAAPRTPSVPRQQALQAPSTSVAPPATVEAPTTIPPTAATTDPTTTTQPATTTPPRTTTATTPPTATDAPVVTPAAPAATPPVPAPEVAAAPGDEAPKLPGGNGLGKGHKQTPDAVPTTPTATAGPATPADVVPAEKIKVHPAHHILCVDVHPLLDACVL